MLRWWRRLLEMPDRARARILARFSFWFVMLLLYALGGVSLYLRARYMRPESTPAAPTPVVVVSPTLAVVESATAFPTATLLPTVTEELTSSEPPTETATQKPVDTETPFPSPTAGLSPSPTDVPPTTIPSLTPEPPSVTPEISTPTASATVTDTATPGALEPPPTRSQN
jgi:hypothetical protein